MSAIHSVFSWFMKKRYHQIELFMKYPVEVQNEVLESLLRQAQSTVWGQKYAYREIRGHKAYSERVPLQSYEDLKPYVKRLKAGEQNLLWPTDINWFAKSSGTTSDRSKFIPVSREALEDCHYKGGKDLLALYTHNHPDNTLYTGKSLVLGGSSQINNFRKDSYWGDLSSILINNLPFWVEFRRVPDKQIALMDGWEEKIEAMAQSVRDEDVTVMAGVPSWTLVLLRRLIELTGVNNISELWPNLQLYMHGGVNFAPYAAQFKELIPSPSTHYYETFNASEGFFALQDQSHSDELLLLLDYGIYYEFIDTAHSHLEQPPTCSLEEVEVGKNYEMVISTNAGLWRYRLGDTVRFTSTSPFRLRVSGRTKHFINAFGEELIIDNAERALKSTCDELGCRVSDYTAGPVYMDAAAKGGAHEWLIEFEHAPDDLALFAERLDSHLRELNSDYDAKRSGNLTLNMPVVRPMPKQTFYKWLKSKGKLGGQHKVPRLSNNREIIEDLYTLNQQAHLSA